MNIDEDINKDRDILNLTFRMKSVYILHYPKGNNIHVSYGLLKGIDEKELNHLCSTEEGSSGSPILSLDNFKVIGIHYGGKSHYQYNKGSFIKDVLNKFYAKFENTIINNKNIQNQNQYNNIKEKEKINKISNIQKIFQSEEFNNLVKNELIEKYKYLENGDLQKLKLISDIYTNIIYGIKLNKQMLDSKGNKINGWSINEYRGNKSYDPPLGWIGFGLKINMIMEMILGSEIIILQVNGVLLIMALQDFIVLIE